MNNIFGYFLIAGLMAAGSSAFAVTCHMTYYHPCQGEIIGTIGQSALAWRVEVNCANGAMIGSGTTTVRKNCAIDPKASFSAYSARYTCAEIGRVGRPNGYYLITQYSAGYYFLGQPVQNSCK